MTQIYRTNNAILSISKYPISQNYLSGAYTALQETDALQRPQNLLTSNVNTYQSLLTIGLGALLIPDNPIDTYIDTYFVPVDSISVSDEAAWDYFEIYDQNAFGVARFIYNKPTFRTITISGKCITNTITDGSSTFITGSKYMYNISNNDSIFSDISNFHKYNIDGGGPKKYFFQVQDGTSKLDLGGYFLPKSWSLEIPAGDFADATWKATFIGPSRSENPLIIPVVGSSTAPTTSVVYRNMNTRDFYIILAESSDTDVNRMTHPIIGCNISTEIDWEKLNTYYGFITGSLPSYTFWSMKNLSGAIKITQLFKTSGRVMIPGPASTNNQNTGMNKYRVMKLDINGNSTIFNKIYWKSPSIDLRTDSALVITREGAYHDAAIVQ